MGFFHERRGLVLHALDELGNCDWGDDSFQTGIGLCGSENAAMLSTFEPLTSVIAGIFVLGDPASVQTGIGIFLVLAAVVALSVYEKAKK